MVTFIAWAGLIGTLLRIGLMTHTQINLDQCTGRFTLNMRAAALSMTASYERLEVERLATIDGCLSIIACPGFLEAFNTAAKIEKAIQTATRVFWQEQASVWNYELTHRCKLPFWVHKSNFPEFEFPIINGSTADLANLKSTEFLINPSTQRYQVSLNYLNLHSEGTLEKGGTFHAWKVYWSN